MERAHNSRWRDLWEWLLAIATVWSGYATGGVLVATVWLAWALRDKPIPQAVSLSLAGLFFVAACFKVWRDERRGSRLKGRAAGELLEQKTRELAERERELSALGRDLADRDRQLEELRAAATSQVVREMSDAEIWLLHVVLTKGGRRDWFNQGTRSVGAIWLGDLAIDDSCSELKELAGEAIGKGLLELSSGGYPAVYRVPPDVQQSLRTHLQKGRTPRQPFPLTNFAGRSVNL